LESHPRLTLAAMVVAAALGWYAAARGQIVPWIFGDEFLYVESARSLAESGSIRARDIPIYYSLITPLLDAPGFLFGDTGVAYGWIKFVNALVMSLSALPAYGLARMAVSRRLSLVVAALVLAWPAFAYTGTVMTEPAFMPAILATCWALARALHRPTLGRQALVVALVIVTILVRIQAVVLFGVVVMAVLIYVATGPPGRLAFIRRLRGLAPLLGASVAIPIVAIVVRRASALGSYSSLQRSRFSLEQSVVWAERHVAVVALSVLVAPLAIAIAAWARTLSKRHSDDAAAAMFVATLAVCLTIFAQVSLFATFNADRVLERNLFTVEPLVLLVSIAALARRHVLRPVAILAVIGLILAVLRYPVTDLLVRQVPFSDTFTMLAYRRGASWLSVDLEGFIRTVGIIGALATPFLVFGRPRRSLGAMIPVVGCGLVLGSIGVSSTVAGYSTAIADSIAPRPFNWVDRAVGSDARVAFVWPSELPTLVAWELEIWNHSIRSVMSSPNPLPVLPGPQASVDLETGRFTLLAGELVPERLVVLWDKWDAVGTPIARASTAGLGLRLWKLDGPLRLAATSIGTYGDGWTGASFELRRFDCKRGGVLRLPVRAGFGPQKRLRIRASGQTLRDVVVPSGPERVIAVPVKPERPGGVCAIKVEVTPALTGDAVVHNGDLRVLGVLLGKPEFRPGPA
jgi:hypothetical protein